MPPSTPRRATVWFVGAATAFSLLGDQTLYSTLPIYFEQLGLQPIEVGIVLSANRWIRLATNELAHRLMGRLDQRLAFVAAVALGAAITAVYASTPTFAVFVLARLAWGLCWSFIRHLGLLSVLAVDEAGRSGRSAGMLGGISRVGSVGGLLGGALLVDWLGFASALIVLAGLSALAIPLALVGFQRFEVGPDREASSGGSSIVAGTLGYINGMVGPGLVMATLGAVLDERLTAGGLLSAASLTGAILALRFAVESGAAARLGALSDIHGIRNVAAASFAAGSAALVLAAASPTLPLLILSVVAFFVSGTTLSAGLLGFAGSGGSRAVARFVTAHDLGSASGPMIGWLALGIFDRRSLGLIIGAVVYGLGAVIALRHLTSFDDRPDADARPASA